MQHAVRRRAPLAPGAELQCTFSSPPFPPSLLSRHAFQSRTSLAAEPNSNPFPSPPTPHPPSQLTPRSLAPLKQGTPAALLAKRHPRRPPCQAPAATTQAPLPRGSPTRSPCCDTHRPRAARPPLLRHAGGPRQRPLGQAPLPCSRAAPEACNVRFVVFFTLGCKGRGPARCLGCRSTREQQCPAPYPRQAARRSAAQRATACGMAGGAARLRRGRPGAKAMSHCAFQKPLGPPQHRAALRRAPAPRAPTRHAPPLALGAARAHKTGGAQHPRSVRRHGALGGAARRGARRRRAAEQVGVSIAYKKGAGRAGAGAQGAPRGAGPGGCGVCGGTKRWCAPPGRAGRGWWGQCCAGPRCAGGLLLAGPAKCSAGGGLYGGAQRAGGRAAARPGRPRGARARASRRDSAVAKPTGGAVRGGDTRQNPRRRRAAGARAAGGKPKGGRPAGGDGCRPRALSHAPGAGQGRGRGGKGRGRARAGEARRARAPRLSSFALQI
jgi:hypothetical protein